MPDGSLGSDSGDGLSAAEVVYPNLGSQLSELAVASAATSGSGAESALGGAAALGGADGGSVLPDGTSYVGGEPPLLTVELEGNRAGVLDFLRDNGVTPVNVVGDYLEVYVPPELLAPLAQQTGVSRVREMPVPFKNYSTSVSALTGAAARDHGAGVWHDNGFTGDGVKIGVIDTSSSLFSADGFTGLRALLGKGLPSTVVGRCHNSVGVPTSDLANCDTAGGDDHGTRVAEAAIHFAPDAELYISNARSWADLQSSVEWMHRQGVKVIVNSVSWPTHGAGDGTTPTVPSPLSTVKWASDNGILWVSSAGNQARKSWLGAFADSDNDGYHEWSGTGSTADESQMFQLGASDVFYLWMSWDDPWRYATKDLDLEVRYSASLNGPRTVVATSSDLQSGKGHDRPYEFVTLGRQGSGYYWVYAKKKAGSAAPSWVQIWTFRRQLEHYTEGGSITSPADSPEPGVLAVGAAKTRSGTLTIESYSSRGPTPDGRTKPDIVGLTCVTTVSGGSMCGTSQAAPNVAGLAALVLERYPAYTARQVADYLKTNAADQGAAGTDNTWGHGFAHLPPSGLDTTFCATTALTGSGTIKGTWSVNCPRDGTSDGIARYYSFALDQQSSVTIRLSTALQDRTRLYLRRGGDTRRGYALSNMIANTDQTAVISMRSLPAGDYTIEARPLGELTLGSFTLDVQGIPALVRSGSEISIAAGADVTEGGDAVFSVTADPAPSAPLTVWVDVSGEGVFGVEEGFRPVTVSTAGSGSLIVSTDDDNADESDGSVTARVVASPRYTVSSSASSASVAVSDDEDTLPLPVAGDACVVALTGSGSFGGEWTDACDSVHLSGRHARFYTFTLDTQSTVTINLTLDHRLYGDLYLRNGSGQKEGAWLARDRSSLYTNPYRDESEISRSLPAGDYTIEAASYYTGSTGPFVLTVAGVPTVAQPVPEVSIASDGDVTEGGGAVFTVSAVPKPAAGLDVEVTVGAVGDFGATAGARTVTVPASGSVKLTVATSGDSVDEPDGSVTASLDAPAADAGYTVSSTASVASVAVSDDDDPLLPVVSVSAGAGVTEGGSARFTLSALPKPSGTMFVQVKVAQLGDFGVLTGTRSVGVPSGGSVSFTVPTSGDSVDEADGSVSVQVMAALGYTVSPTAGSASVAVSDDDDPPPVVPVVSVSAGAGVTEGGDAVFTVSAVPKPAADLDVEVTVAAVGDFGAATGAQTVTVPASGSVKVTVATSGDSVDEADGSVSVSLDAPAADAGYTVSATAGSASVAVSDDDDPPPVVVPEPDPDPPVVVPVCSGRPTLSVADASAVRGEDLEFVFGLSCRSSSSVKAYFYVMRDGEIDGSGQILTIGAGEWARSVMVPTADSEKVSLGVPIVLGAANSRAGTATGTVVTTPSVVSVAAGADVVEGAAATFTVSAAPSPSAPLEVSVSVAAVGSFGAATGVRSVTVPTSGSVSFSVATADDSVDEADGSVTATLAAGDGYSLGTAKAATVGVADDDDPLPEVSFTAGSGGTEGVDVSFTVTASSAPAADLAVGVAVAASGDFGVAVGTRTVTIPKGATSATLAVATAGDSVDEPDGSVTATLRAGGDYVVGVPASRTVAVADDDDPPPSVVSVAAGGGVVEGGDAVFTVSASPAPSVDVDVSVSVSSAGEWGVAGGSRTVQLAAGAATATLRVPTVDDRVDEADGSVTVSLDAPGSDGGYTVSASAGSALVGVADDDVDPLTVYMIFFSRSIEENGAGYDNQAGLNIGLTRTLRAWETVTVPLSVTGRRRGARIGRCATSAIPTRCSPTISRSSSVPATSASSWH